MIALIPTLRIIAGSDGDSNEIQCGILGGLITLLLVFIPLAPLLGGFVSRVLVEKRRPTVVESELPESNSKHISGFRIGAISGLVPILPLTLAWLYFFLFMVGFPGGPPPLWYAALISFAGCVIIASYTVIMGGIGGVFGSSLIKRGLTIPGF